MKNQESTIRRAQGGNRRARNELLLAARRLASRVARRWAGNHLDVDDAEQEAILGTIKAIRGYDGTKGTWERRMERYMSKACQKALKRSGVVSLPVHNGKGSWVIPESCPSEVSLHDDSPRPDEIAATRDDVAQCRRLLNRLPVKQRLIVACFFGIGRRRRMTLKLIGERLMHGASKQAAAARIGRALVQLRREAKGRIE